MTGDVDVDDKTGELAFLDYALTQNPNMCVAAYRAVDDGEDFEFVAVNANLEKVEKLSHDELVNRKVTEVFPGIKEFGLLDVFRRVYRSGKSERLRGCVYRDDRIVGLRDNFVSKLPHSGIVIATYDSGRQLREILDSMFGFVSLFLPDGTLIETNQASLDAANLQRDDVLGKPYWDAYWWSHSKEVQLQIKECLLGAARGETVRQDLSVRIAEDQTIIVNATFGPLREESGEITRLVGFGVDITERERSNEELRESEARYRSIIDTTNEGFSRVDENMRIVEVNDALCRMLGYTRDELLGKTPFDLVGATEYQNSTEPHNELFHDAAQAQRQEMQFRKKDGSFLDVHVSSSGYFNAKGIPSGEFSFVTDITERKEHDEQLRQALKMEAVGRLTGGVAHEFNNLLMVVLGNIELLESHLQEDDPLRSFTSSAMKAVLRGSELTQSLLAFSRKQKLESSNVDLNELVIGTQHLFQRTLGETIIIDTELAKGIWHTAADAGQIEAALLNFVLNSRDAMPQGGTITVRTSNRQMTADTAAHFDCVGPGDYVMLEVTDTGTGMTAEQIEHAFEPFYTTKKIGEGTGLGLSVAYGFAKQSGGCLEIESEPGKGTTVRLCLPRTVETAVAADSKQEKSVEVGSGRILVVEDDDDVRTLAVKQLISLGYDVTEAADGVEMLALLDGDSDFDLLFSDVILPGGMSGPEAAKEAQRKRPHLKVLLTSGHPQKHIEDLPVGGKDMVVLTKPYRKAELAEAIMAAMNAT